MELFIGSTYVVAELTTAIDKTGREHLLIVAKGTWAIPTKSLYPRPIKATPLQYADIHVGEPGLSAPLYESDFVLKKNRCDVIFNAKAHAPDNQPVRELKVAYRIGAHINTMNVVGKRIWQKSLLDYEPSKPEPFTEMPLHYGMAYGGSCAASSKQPDLLDTFETNPIGMGYAGRKGDADIEGLPVACLERIDQAITRPDGKYEPIALSPIARHWLPRRQYSGTYDDAWKKNVFPFLPEDFDERFNQCAPEERQIDFPKGGEEVVMINMMKGRPDVRFKLPRFDKLPVRILMRDYTVEHPPIVVDTLYFEPDENRFSAIWRTSLPIKRNIRDIKTIAIGGICKNWWDAKIIGAEGCMNCAKQRSTQEAAPPEEECEKEKINAEEVR